MVDVSPATLDQNVIFIALLLPILERVALTVADANVYQGGVMLGSIIQHLSLVPPCDEPDLDISNYFPFNQRHSNHGYFK
ncbi:hypothetical protein SAMN05216420_103168 [Nitrosospira sp. Nl5]|nr:hypothetical protein SAMN05216420_103168 [Nitrosospira sp. Nl5]